MKPSVLVLWIKRRVHAKVGAVDEFGQLFCIKAWSIGNVKGLGTIVGGRKPAKEVRLCAKVAIYSLSASHSSSGVSKRFRASTKVTTTLEILCAVVWTGEPLEDQESREAFDSVDRAFKDGWIHVVAAKSGHVDLESAQGIFGKSNFVARGW